MYFSSDVSGDEDDARLVRQSLAGETEAFGLLVERYQHVMHRVALRMVGNPEDARDITQEAFVKAYGQLAKFDPSYRFFSWLYRIVINECLNLLRARRPQEPLNPAATAAGSPFESVLARQRLNQIEAAMLQLPPDYRSVVVLRHFAEQSYAEISAVLEIPEKTVKSRLYSARQLLGEMLLGWREQAKEAQ